MQIALNDMVLELENAGKTVFLAGLFSQVSSHLKSNEGHLRRPSLSRLCLNHLRLYGASWGRVKMILFWVMVDVWWRGIPAE